MVLSCQTRSARPPSLRRCNLALVPPAPRTAGLRGLGLLALLAAVVALR